MKPEQIIWRQYSAISDRSQELYGGDQDMYVISRTKKRDDRGLLTNEWKYCLLQGGHDRVWYGDNLTDMLKNLWPHKMTPLEIKCWEALDAK